MKKLHIFILITSTLFFVVLLFWVYTLFLPVSSTQSDPQDFVIPKGQAIAQIGERLYEAGLIKHPVIFRLAVTQQDVAGKIQAGSFTLSPTMSVIEIAQRFTEGTEDVWITLLEGWRAEEMADYLEDKDELSLFDRGVFLEEAAAYPGMLYPDTYLIPKEIQAEDIVALLVATFETKIEAGLADEIAASGRDLSEVLVMASLVQREARDFEQMRHVAGILWNRVDIGMALQVDATLQYVKGNSEEWWPTPLASDKQLTSAFNTYQNPGLPPQPIANPGIDALRATLTPLSVDDLFYIHDPKTGEMYYAATIDEHNANVNKYLR